MNGCNYIYKIKYLKIRSFKILAAPMMTHACDIKNFYISRKKNLPEKFLDN